ncbi:MAG: diguanylate cyclase [Xanthomonadales bacterium]|nr:diguanylate cyclase [Xanthomonadales bacterium]
MPARRFSLAPGHALARLLIAIAVAAISTTLALTEALSSVDDWLVDRRISFSRTLPDERILLVLIDEHSLSGHGRWPWPRATLASLIDRLDAGNPRAIALDLLLSEVEPGQGDELLADALQRSGRVVLPVAVEEERPGGVLIEILPHAGLAPHAMVLGHTTVAQSHDGRARGVFLRAGLGGPHWSHLSLALTEGADPLPLERLPGMAAPTRTVSSPFLWQQDRFVLVGAGRFVQGKRHDRVSAADVLAGHLDNATLQDRFVLVGATARGLGERLRVPAASGDALMSGVEFHAAVLDELHNGRLLVPLPLPAVAGLSILLVLTPFVFVWSGRVRVELLSVLAAISLTILITVFLLGRGVWFPPTAVLSVLILLVPLLMADKAWRWRMLADNDGLTGMANRRRLDRQIAIEWASTRRSGTSLAVLLVDVDHFKAFNDRHGHGAGDQALRSVAEVLLRHARRPHDLAARYGGEEFAVVLPDCDLDDATRVAEEIRSEVRALPPPKGLPAGVGPLTVSIGVACRRWHADGRAQDLLDDADRALYAAKAAGRDRVHGPDPG